MLFYLTSFVVTLFFSALFATGGVGSAIVLIPVLSLMGVGFDLAKASGLFVNTVTTSTASIINYRKGFVDFRGTFPFLLVSAAIAPLGAYSAQYINVTVVKLLFAMFLFFSAYAILSQKKPDYVESYSKKWLMYPLGGVVGFMAGLLGIGGGALIIPALFYMRFPPKKIASTVSFMIPVSTFIAFLAYLWLVDIDWLLIATTALAAVLGGIVGTRVMHRYLGDVQMKKLLAGILCLIALKMIYDMIFV